jgi:putative glycosyltransferase
MKLSIVTTMYRSAPYLDEFYRRITATADSLTPDFEVVFVDDGSPDNSLAVALELQRRDSRVRVVELSRNFGHHAAMLTGLSHARGEQVFLIDCDLEEPPETLRQFAQIQTEQQADVVYGVQASRAGGWWDRFNGWLFYKLFRYLSTDPLPENVMTVRLMSRTYVQALVQHQETELQIGSLWVRTGFRQIPVAVVKKKKPTTTYNLSRRIAVAVNAITSSSNKPLVYIFYLGCLITMVSLIAAGMLMIQRLFVMRMQDGWVSLMVSLWLLGGLIIFCQGVLGIYLSKVFLESKRRPRVFIREIHEAPVPVACPPEPSPAGGIGT